MRLSGQGAPLLSCYWVVPMRSQANAAHKSTGKPLVHVKRILKSLSPSDKGAPSLKPPRCRTHPRRQAKQG